MVNIKTMLFFINIVMFVVLVSFIFKHVISCDFFSKREPPKLYKLQAPQNLDSPLIREIIAVCSEIRTKRINALCGQNITYKVTTGLKGMSLESSSFSPHSKFIRFSLPHTDGVSITADTVTPKYVCPSVHSHKHQCTGC
jgi:hypothetical protein